MLAKTELDSDGLSKYVFNFLKKNIIPYKYKYFKRLDTNITSIDIYDLFQNI